MKENTRRTEPHVISPTTRPRGPSRFEWRVVDIPRDMTRSDARALLTGHAEYGQWELARSVTYLGGARRVWLRRRTIHVMRTDAA